jgi:GH24 family phage-related lysozyme (muramidase)
MDAMKYIEGVLARWETQSNKAAEITKEHPSPEGFWPKVNPFDPKVIEQHKALDPGSVSDAPLKKWWDENFGGSATPGSAPAPAPAPAVSGQRRPGGRVRLGGGAVPLMGGLAPDEWPESTNIEDRRGEAPFQPGEEEANKTQQELMEQTKRLAEDFERLFADYGGAAGLAGLGGTGGAAPGSLAAQAGLNDIGGAGGAGGGGGAGGPLGIFGGGGLGAGGGGLGGVPGMGGLPGLGGGGFGGRGHPGRGGGGGGGGGGFPSLPGLPGLGGHPGLPAGHPSAGGGGRRHGGAPHGSDVGPGTGPGAGDSDPGTPGSEKFIRAVKRFEGFAPRAAWDYKQWTSGYGTKAGFKGEPITKEEAEKRLRTELGEAGKAVDRINPNLDPGTHAALTDLVFNAGAGALKGIHDAIARGDIEAIRRWLPQHYTTAGGQQLPALVKRRAEEATWVGSQDFRDAEPGAAGTAHRNRFIEQARHDRAALDNQMAQKVEGTGKLSVHVNAPRGTKVGAEGGGLFKKTEVTRQTQMEPAASSMASQYQE